ncbi:LOW QUALITY PROTEIN: hypothetical protein PFNF135_05449 [Plasmodium falciparum NF135/5.C10]|uniref:Uncharacterized protein n=1 Tax=Plasmodium falciparum NF135/5.C10 TaxID=1036726 RepID=W4I965_PLAFA|nr:LOW QUALITY PROTEIN: hypothetical protein PFNF135_05449 [Plasmodium falciparum NF135/5.C10]
MQNHKYHLIYATCNSQQMTDKKKIMKTYCYGSNSTCTVGGSYCYCYDLKNVPILRTKSPYYEENCPQQQGSTTIFVFAKVSFHRKYQTLIRMETLKLYY